MLCSIYIFNTLIFLIENIRMHIFFQSTYVNIKIDKVTSIHDISINHQVGNLDNQGIIDC